MLPIPRDKRFAKPAKESLVDLINERWKAALRPDEVTFGTPESIGGSSPSELASSQMPAGIVLDEEPNTLIRMTQVGNESGPVIVLLYHRLDLSKFIRFPLIAKIDPNLGTGIELVQSILDQVLEEHNVRLDLLDSFVGLDAPDANNYQPLVIAASPINLIFTGALDTFGAPVEHIRHSFSSTELDGFTLDDLKA